MEVITFLPDSCTKHFSGSQDTALLYETVVSFRNDLIFSPEYLTVEAEILPVIEY